MQKQSKLLQYAHQLFQDARESYYQAAQARARAGVELERAEDLRTAFAEAFARPARSASELYAAGRGAKRATPPRSAQPPAIPLSSYRCCELLSPRRNPRSEPGCTLTRSPPAASPPASPLRSIAEPAGVTEPAGVVVVSPGLGPLCAFQAERLAEQESELAELKTLSTALVVRIEAAILRRS